MAGMDIAQLGFNRGVKSPLALARADVQHTGWSAEEQSNWMPRTLGSMMLRPGLGYIGSTKDNNKAVHIDFIRSLSVMAALEITDENMRIRISETLITRASVSTAFSNGTFDSDLTGWTDSDDSGGTSAWVTGGYMGLAGSGFAAARRRQTLTVAGGDQNVEHAMRIIVSRGTIVLRVGSSSGGDEYINETALGVGTHSLAFTPTGASVYVELAGYAIPNALVDSIAIEAAGVLSLPVPWTEADLYLIRWTQSVDVLYVACPGYQQRKIERRGTNSWSIVLYQPKDGPFRNDNGEAITMTPGALTGNTTITASRAYFRSTHVGALMRLTSVGQQVSSTLTAGDQWSDPIRVSGVENSRIFYITITGTWVMTITLQRSVGEVGSWEDVTTYTTNQASTAYDDGLDNQIIYYRIGVKTPGYGSGTAVVSLVYASGSLTGIARITTYTSATVVSADVLTPFGNTTGSSLWAEGVWSDYRGWPTAVEIDDGRLCWFGNDRAVHSVSDSYESFDDTIEGNSAPINRSIGRGAVANINWAASLQRLLLGADLAEYVISASSLDEALSATAYNIKSPTNEGSASIACVKIDDTVIYVHRSGTRLLIMEYDGTKLQYGGTDLSLAAPELLEAGIIKIGVQRKPDTRIHCLLEDGTVAILVHDKAENTRCWVTLDTDGDVEDVVVFPGDVEDRVYYTVKRTINGSTVRYWEKMALESECVGGTLNKQADSFITYTGAATTTVTAAHLAGEQVIVWADGVDLSPDVDGVQTLYTLNGSGHATIASATNYVVGLPYSARFKGGKLAGLMQSGSSTGKKARIAQLGVVLYKTHALGLKYGRSFDSMDNLPLVVDGAEVDADTIHDGYDRDAFMFPGSWENDARLHLKAVAPRPCTVVAAVIGVESYAAR